MLDDIDALFGDASEEEEDDDFLARELAQLSNNSAALSIDIPDCDLAGSVDSRSTASLSPSSFLGLCLPTPGSSHANTPVSRSASPSPSRTRPRKRKTWEELDNEGAHLPSKKKQNVGTTALPVSPVTAAELARTAHPVSSRGPVARAHQRWPPKSWITRPWPTLSPRPPEDASRQMGLSTSQNDVYSRVGVAGGFDQTRRRSPQPAGSNPHAPIDLTREPSPAPPSTSSQVEAHRVLASLPVPLLEALHRLLITPNAVPLHLHELLTAFLYPSTTLFKSTKMPSLAKLMTALKEYLPSKAAPSLSPSPSLTHASSGGTIPLSHPPSPRRPSSLAPTANHGPAAVLKPSLSRRRLGRARNVGIGVLPEPLRQANREPDSVKDSVIAPSTLPSSSPTATLPNLSAGPHSMKKTRLKDLRTELEAQRARIAQSFAKARVTLRDLQVEESVLVNLKKRLDAAEDGMPVTPSDVPLEIGDKEMEDGDVNELDTFLNLFAGEEGIGSGLLHAKELLGADFNFD